MKTGIKILSAKYLNEYKIAITFSDGVVNIFDYETLVMRDHEEFKTYKDLNEFKKFQIIANGTMIGWGENWEMVLPLNTLYTKKQISKAGRKRVADKKHVVRIYVPQSVIRANGGIENSAKKCTEYLMST